MRCRGAPSHFFIFLAQLKTRCAFGHDECGYDVSFFIPAAYCGHQNNTGVVQADIGHKLLCAIQNPFVTFQNSPCPQGACIGTGIGLGKGKGPYFYSPGYGNKPFFLLLFRSKNVHLLPDHACCYIQQRSQGKITP